MVPYTVRPEICMGSFLGENVFGLKCLQISIIKTQWLTSVGKGKKGKLLDTVGMN